MFNYNQRRQEAIQKLNKNIEEINKNQRISSERLIQSEPSKALVGKLILKKEFELVAEKVILDFIKSKRLANESVKIVTTSDYYEYDNEIMHIYYENYQTDLDSLMKELIVKLAEDETLVEDCDDFETMERCLQKYFCELENKTVCNEKHVISTVAKVERILEEESATVDSEVPEVKNIDLLKDLELETPVKSNIEKELVPVVEAQEELAAGTLLMSETNTTTIKGDISMENTVPTTTTTITEEVKEMETTTTTKGAKEMKNTGKVTKLFAKEVIAKLEAMGVDVTKFDTLNSQEAFTALKKRVLKADQVVNFVKINIAKVNNSEEEATEEEYSVKVGVSAMPSSVLLRTAKVSTGDMKMEVSKGIVYNVENATSEFISVDLSQVSNEFAYKIENLIIRNNGGVFTLGYLANGLVRDLETGKNITAKFYRKDGVQKSGCTTYKLTFDAPSGKRTGKVMGFTTARNWAKVFIDATCEGVETYVDKKMFLPEMVKVGARAFSVKSPSKALFEIKGVAILVDALNTSDGNALMTRLGGQSAMKAYLGLEEDAIVYDKKGGMYAIVGTELVKINAGLDFIQARPITAKVFATRATDKMVQELLDGKVVVKFDGPCAEAQEYVNWILAKGKRPANAPEKIDALVIGEPEFIGDTNAFKLGFNVFKMGHMQALEMPKFSGTVNLNIQLLEKFAVVDPKATLDLIRNCAKTQFTKELNAFNTLDQAAINYAEANKVNLTEAFEAVQNEFSPSVPKNADFLTDLAKSVSRDFFNTCVPMRRKFLADLGLRWAGLVSKFKFETEGGFLRLIPDYTANFVKGGVLKYEEVFSPDFQGKDAFVLRTPSMHLAEGHNCRSLTRTEYIDLIKANEELTEGQKKACIDFVHSIPAGCLVMPATLELMNKLGGNDFDFDGVLFYVGKDVTDISKKIQDMIIEIQAGAKAKYGNIYTFSFDNLYKDAYVATMKPADLNVGIISNENTAIIQAIIDITIAELTGVGMDKAVEFSNIIIEAMTKAYEKSTGNKAPESDSITAYVGLPETRIVKVSETTATEVFLEFMASDRSTDSTVKFLKDMNCCYRLYQEGVIDSDKTGILPAITVRAKGVKLEMTKKIAIENNGPNGEFMKQRKINPGQVLGSSTTFSKLQNQLANFVVGELNKEVLFDQSKWMQLSSEVNLSKRDKSCLSFIQSMYSDVMKVYMNMRSEEIKGFDSEEEYEKVKRFLPSSLYRKDMLAKLGNMIRHQLSGLTVRERGIVAMLLSNVYITKDGRMVEGKPSSFYNVLKEEVAALIMGEDQRDANAPNFFGTKIKSVRKGAQVEVGQTLEFKNGFSTDLAFVCDIDNGVYTIKEYNGDLYASIEVELNPSTEAPVENIFTARSTENAEAAFEKLNNAEEVKVVCEAKAGKFTYAVFAGSEVICNIDTFAGMKYDAYTAMTKVKSVSMTTKKITDRVTGELKEVKGLVFVLSK